MKKNITRLTLAARSISTEYVFIRKQLILLLLYHFYLDIHPSVHSCVNMKGSLCEIKPFIHFVIYQY